MNIIKSDLITAQYDVMWAEIAALTSGMTKKPVLVLVNDNEQDSNESQQLQKMLDACKLIPPQYNIIGLKNDVQVAWHKLREQVNPQIIFLVGIHPAQLGISALFRLNEPNSFNNRLWLPTVSIKELDAHPDVKKQLWLNGMKPLFIDKPVPVYSQQ